MLCAVRRPRPNDTGVQARDMHAPVGGAIRMVRFDDRFLAEQCTTCLWATPLSIPAKDRDAVETRTEGDQ